VWAYATLGMKNEPFLESLAEEASRRVSDYVIEDLAKSSWSWATLGWVEFTPLILALCTRALHLPPEGTYGAELDTAHAFIWSLWTIASPDVAWSIFHSWASQGMVIDAASFGLLMGDSAMQKSLEKENSMMGMMERSSQFPELKDIFNWSKGGKDLKVPDYAMKFDTRICDSGIGRGSHHKLSTLAAFMLTSDAADPMTVLSAIREFSYGEGNWLKVAGGGKANLIEDVLKSRPAVGQAELALEFGVFVGYTTVRIGARSQESTGPGAACPLVVGLEVEPVHVCVARWIVDIAGLSQAVEIWAGIAHDTSLRVGDEFGMYSTRMMFMDHRGTKFHDDLQQLEELYLLAPAAAILADNTLKPAAPHFVWMVNKSRSYRAINWSVGEFVQYYVEDWMVAAEYLGPTGNQVPWPPAALDRLAWDSDRWRRKSEDDSVRVSEWAAFAVHAREVFSQHGLEAQPWLN